MEITCSHTAIRDALINGKKPTQCICTRPRNIQNIFYL